MRSTDTTRPTRFAILGALAALALGGALAVPGAADAASTPSTSAAASATSGVDYTCSGGAGASAVSGLPLHIAPLQTMTAPAGAFVGGLSSAVSLPDLAGRLAGQGLPTTFGASSLTLTVGAHAEQVVGTIDAGGTLSLPTFGVPDDARLGSTVSLTAPQTFALRATSGALTSLACARTGSAAALGAVVIGPAADSQGAQPAGPTMLSVEAVLGARLVDRVVLAGRHARVRVTVWTAETGSRPRPVTVTTAGHRVGRARLVKRSVTVRLAVMSPGRHDVVVRVAGLSQRLTLRVVR